jgi:RimJ/RimL family protein N-acetyltransferase
MHDKCLPLNLLPVLTQEQIITVAQLASRIWNEHFPAIIGHEQVNYMLEKFQSYQAINEQISAGYHYYLLELDHHPIGYMAIKIDQVDAHMQLSKFYLLQQVRRQGVGTEALSQLKNIARSQHIHRIWLTVNKYNTLAINAYKKMGFETTEELVMDIGQGFVMDDYRMELMI